MSLFSKLLVLAVAILGGILVWDLSEERLVYPGKKLIVFADMFGPGEPMQQLYGGPADATVPPQPFTRDHIDHYRALAAAQPRFAGRIAADARRIHGLRLDFADRPAAVEVAASAPVPPDASSTAPDLPGRGGAAPGSGLARLIEDYRGLDAGYVAGLVDALGQSDRGNRLRLFHAFAAAHPRFERDMVLTFERLHPGYSVGLFEDFERLHPDYKILPRWDGRGVLSANRPRFLTGADVPDIIVGTTGELRILMREDLGLPLDQPIADAAKDTWRARSILDGERAYDDPQRTWRSEFYPWALDRARYTVTAEDHDVSENPHRAGDKVLYFLPRQVHTLPVFYNKAHFRLIGRDPEAPPRTVEEFEAVCRQLIAKGKEPIANDGAVYISSWWDWLVIRTIGYEGYAATIQNRPGAGRFAGPGADPRYLQIARRLRRWRDEGFWMKNFSASQWPGAQRDFGNGRCSFLLTGTWLPTEIAGTCSRDKSVFDLGCFFFPQSAGGAGDANGIPIVLQGFVLCRQGRNHENAVLLLRYLTARGGSVMARKVNYISATRGVPFPPALSAIERTMTAARTEDYQDEGPGWYAPKFNKFVLNETFPEFFVIRENGMDPEQFVEALERKAQEQYAEHKGTAE